MVFPAQKSSCHMLCFYPAVTEKSFVGCAAKHGDSGTGCKEGNCFSY